jgi:hypothetical protein
MPAQRRSCGPHPLRRRLGRRTQRWGDAACRAASAAPRRDWAAAQRTTARRCGPAGCDPLLDRRALFRGGAAEANRRPMRARRPTQRAPASRRCRGLPLGQRRQPVPQRKLIAFDGGRRAPRPTPRAAPRAGAGRPAARRPPAAPRRSLRRSAPPPAASPVGQPRGRRGLRCQHVARAPGVGHALQGCLRAARQRAQRVEQPARIPRRVRRPAGADRPAGPLEAAPGQRERRAIGQRDLDRRVLSDRGRGQGGADGPRSGGPAPARSSTGLLTHSARAPAHRTVRVAHSARAPAHPTARVAGSRGRRRSRPGRRR